MREDCLNFSCMSDRQYRIILKQCLKHGPPLYYCGSKESCILFCQVRTIKNDPNRDESNREEQRMKRSIDFWKQQAQSDPHERVAVSDMIQNTLG